nr:DUF6538 domain-containing protein [Rhodopseudomonas pseudopalustris]
MYYWRRRLPRPLKSWFHKRHLFLGLGTADTVFARRLAVLLDAKLEEIVTAFEQADLHLTSQQVDGLLRDVVRTHLDKLERLAAAGKSCSSFDADQAKRDDRRAAWTYRLLHSQGSAAIVGSLDEQQMSAEGMTLQDIAAIRNHLSLLRKNNLVPTRPDILQDLVGAHGAPATAMNMATAQDIYFRGMWMALAQSDRRYGGNIVEADDFVAQIFRDRVQPVQRVQDEREMFAHAAMAESEQQQPFETVVERNQPDDVDDRFESIADILVKKRLKARRWTIKSKKQAEQIFSLMEKFMLEERSVEKMSLVRQKDLAAFTSFLEAEIYKHHGKSSKDEFRSIAEMRVIAMSKPENMRGVEAGTLNRHLTFIDQLFDCAVAEGVEMDPRLSLSKLRAIDSSETRAREERTKFSLGQIEKLFEQAPFVNCARWDKLSQFGADGHSLVYHGALYFIPMLIFYGGGRLEEYCGLIMDDVIETNGAHPYLHIAKNKYRRIKNAASKRNIVIHPELIRLGFLRYVALIRSLDYELVFPDLFSPTTKSLLGSRFYKLFKPVLLSAGITEDGLGSHAIRHAFGAILKKRNVRDELRADLLGHRGKTETSERYCEATEISTMYELVCKMPVVTENLVAHPTNIFQWVREKHAPPFSHPNRAKRERTAR